MRIGFPASLKPTFSRRRRFGEAKSGIVRGTRRASFRADLPAHGGVDRHRAGGAQCLPRQGAAALPSPRRRARGKWASSAAAGAGSAAGRRAYRHLVHVVLSYRAGAPRFASSPHLAHALPF